MYLVANKNHDKVNKHLLGINPLTAKQNFSKLSSGAKYIFPFLIPGAK